MTTYFGPIGDLAAKNTFFRRVLFTSEHAQLVLMSLEPGQEIGEEIHADVDQIFRIERGEAKFVFGKKKERMAREGDTVIVPMGTRHNVVNASPTEPLKVCTLYAPPNHPDGTIHKTKADAEAVERAHV